MYYFISKVLSLISNKQYNNICIFCNYNSALKEQIELWKSRAEEYKNDLEEYQQQSLEYENEMEQEISDLKQRNNDYADELSELKVNIIALDMFL